ncbi:hypothetical protein QUA74_19235 [Microcoleus sp. LAD1_D3]|uniref:hypothetical protein n=1 Tax=Microcoleus sp. LAD1_D3 TaxID=2819365 RepID=UPI002FD56CF1
MNRTSPAAFASECRSPGLQATPNAGWETSSRLSATGAQNLVFLFYRPNYPNQQLKSPPAVR